jgi:hypothetical protein
LLQCADSEVASKQGLEAWLLDLGKTSDITSSSSFAMMQHYYRLDRDAYHITLHHCAMWVAVDVLQQAPPTGQGNCVVPKRL